VRHSAQRPPELRVPRVGEALVTELRKALLQVVAFSGRADRREDTTAIAQCYGDSRLTHGTAAGVYQNRFTSNQKSSKYSFNETAA